LKYYWPSQQAFTKPVLYFRLRLMTVEYSSDDGNAKWFLKVLIACKLIISEFPDEPLELAA